MTYWLSDPAARAKALAELRARQIERRAREEAERAPRRALRGSAAKRGPDACRAYLRSQMREPLDDAHLSKQKEYKSYCMNRFKISARTFFKIWTEVAAETKCAWAKAGRPPHKSRGDAPAPKDSIIILPEPTLELGGE